MFTYKSPLDGQQAKPTEKPWVLLLLCFVWLWPGIFSHDLWKPHEPYIYEAVKDMIATGSVVAPNVHGFWYLETPPLYLWVGALFQQIFSPWLVNAYDATRLATPFFMVLALTFAGMAGRALLGRRHGRSVVLILIGCAGMMMTGHAMDSMAATFMGYAMGFYAFSTVQTRPALSGFLLGLSWVIVFLSSNLLSVFLMLMVALFLLFYARWRTKRYAISLSFAVLVALPLGFLWPNALAKTNPDAFAFWWQQYALGQLNHLSFKQFFSNLGYYLTVMSWSAFPAWPLALWTIYRRQYVSAFMLKFCGFWFLTILFILSLSNHQATENALPLLLPLAVLGGAQLDNLRRGPAAFLNWFGAMTFGALAIFIWLGFLAMNFGWPEKLAERALYFSPYYEPKLYAFAIVFSLMMTPVWLWAVTRRHLRGRQAVTNWAAGMTLVWLLMLSLFLPWLDKIKSYRPVVDQMVSSLDARTVAAIETAEVCIQAQSRQLVLLTAWREYSDLPINTFEYQLNDCDYWLNTAKREPFLVMGQADPAGWAPVWMGHRPRENNEWFVLYQKQAKPKRATMVQPEADSEALWFSSALDRPETIESTSVFSR
ncbi:MAG: hypothetical protein KBC57_06770 [Neisseriaceae bacterium]|nr:hypothetical protein [Neisseriaceae bacterium]MBP6862041.1 hypothetical protein [Neisseriaceae bacterium]